MNIDPLAEKARRKMVARRMTPEVLAAQEGILAVFVGVPTWVGTEKQKAEERGWGVVVEHVRHIAEEVLAGDMLVRIDDTDSIRFMLVGGIQCIVVHQHDGRIMKSLPRSMRRCIEHVRRCMKKDDQP